jgi:hypothetical protein
MHCVEVCYLSATAIQQVLRLPALRATIKMRHITIIACNMPVFTNYTYYQVVEARVACYRESILGTTTHSYYTIHTAHTRAS